MRREALPQFDIGPCVGLIRLLHVDKLEVVVGVLEEVTRPRQFLDQGEKVMMIPTVVVQLDLSNQLDFDSIVIQARPGFPQLNIHLPKRQGQGSRDGLEILIGRLSQG